MAPKKVVTAPTEDLTWAQDCFLTIKLETSPVCLVRPASHCRVA